MDKFLSKNLSFNLLLCILTVLKKNQFTEAVDDCNQVLKMEPNNVKALLRRGTAYQNYPGRNYKHVSFENQIGTLVMSLLNVSNVLTIVLASFEYL